MSGSRSRAAGGVFEVERALAQKLYHRHHAMVEAAGYLDENSANDNLAWEPIQVHCFERRGPQQFGYSPRLRHWLKSSKHDLLHLHNLWMYTSLLALRWHRRTGRPFVVTPHGMLDRWALKNSGWKKRLAGLLYENSMLRNASVIHGFHAKDLEDFRRYGLRNPIAVIPNGVDLPVANMISSNRSQRILYLGRLHPKKGLAELIQAWSLISIDRRQGWQLTIAGWDDGGHLPGLKQLVERLRLQESIEFSGPVFGEEKQLLFNTSAGFILPSFSEGLPMTILEAWAHSIPAIMTDMCNLPQGFAASAAIKIAPAPQDIARGLDSFFSLSESQRQQLGANGRMLVEREFTWDKVSDQLMAVYRWILGSGPKPNYVHTEI